MLRHLFIKVLGSIMEDNTEKAVVNLQFIIIEFVEVGHILIEELQRAGTVAVDGFRSEQRPVGIRAFDKSTVEDLHDFRCLANRLRLHNGRFLLRFEIVMLNGLWSFNHELEHETTHLMGIAIVSTVVIHQGDIGGTLQKSVEVVSIDSRVRRWSVRTPF